MWNGTGSWTISSLNTRTCLSCKSITTAVGHLVTQRDSKSQVTDSTDLFSMNLSAMESEGLQIYYQNPALPAKRGGRSVG